MGTKSRNGTASIRPEQGQPPTAGEVDKANKMEGGRAAKTEVMSKLKEEWTINFWCCFPSITRLCEPSGGRKINATDRSYDRFIFHFQAHLFHFLKIKARA